MDKTVAVIVTEYRPDSHADVIVGRLLGDHGYTPRVRVVSMYTDQVPDNDKSREMASKHGFTICPTIDEAIAVGAPEHLVDGIVVIGEHGQYPWNEKEQHMYPRRRLMEETFHAMDRLGLRVPIFLDKHFSYDNESATWIYEQSRRRGVPLLAGSSIPYTEAKPDYDHGILKSAECILVTSYGGTESYGFHALEVLQSLAEHREGAETGVESVLALSGDAVWQAMDRDAWPGDLLEQALSVQDTASGEHPRQACPAPILFEIRYRDGFRGFVAQLPSYCRGWAYAIRDGSGRVTAAQCQVGGRPFPHFATLTAHIEDMVLEGRLPCSTERTYLTTMLINCAMESLYTGERCALPQLAISYEPIIYPAGRRE